MNRITKIFFLLICGLYLFSCGSEVSSFDESSLSSGSGGGGSTDSGNGDSAADPTPPSDYNLSHFFVALDTSTTYPHYVSQLNSHGTKCSIAPTSTGNDLSCVVEVPELSLFYGGLSFAINVPAGMCEYVSELPYWYYNKEVGYGPPEVHIEKTTNADAGVSFRCSVNGSGLSSNCSGFQEVNFNATGDDMVAECVYGSECCLGSYTLTTTNITIDASGTPTSTVSSKDYEWGDSIRSCIGGAAKTNWTIFNGQGRPNPKLTEMRDGDLMPYTVMAPMLSVGVPTNIPVSNFYTVLSPAASSPHYHTGFGTASGSTSVLPYYLDPISDRSGDTIIKANPYYEYSCLNDAYEIKNRIRVYVREWDDYAAYTSYVSTGVVSGTPWDVTPGSVEGGADCDGLSPDLCNDLIDGDNFVYNLLGNIYDTTASGTTRRNNYFPANDYN